MFQKKRKTDLLGVVVGFALSLCGFADDQIQSMATTIDQGELLFGDGWGEEFRAACKYSNEHHTSNPVVAIYLKSNVAEDDSKTVLIYPVFEKVLSPFDTVRPEGLEVSIVSGSEKNFEVESKRYAFDRGAAAELWEASASVCAVVASGKAKTSQFGVLVNGPDCYVISTHRKGDDVLFRDHLGVSIGPYARGAFDEVVKKRLQMIISDVSRE